ncbi:hypothetical protein G9A89_019079 [Geosiphon pyriformis]|nr:hypothetical protein G9A89_019079 [Geosiphon pyriformis]
MVIQKDTENEMKNHASLVENRYQEGATETTYQDKLYNIAQAKIRKRTTKEIRCWKVSAKIADEVTNYNMFNSVDEFQENYQQLCSTHQEQEQYLVQINTYLCKDCLIPCQKISVQEEVIDSGYTENLMILLQNNSEKSYTIESKEKIAQAIFLPLIKILITNTIEELIYISENTIMEYLGTELENMSTPQEILNFPEIAFYCKLTSINWQQPLECYQFMPEKLAKLNIGTMDLDQQ